MSQPAPQPTLEGWLRALRAGVETAIRAAVRADLDAESELLRLDRELATGEPGGIPAAAPEARMLVRPYAMVGRRLEPGNRIAVEALVRATPRGNREAPTVTARWRTILGLCQQTRSVAELATYGEVPIGVARGIVAEMADAGLLDIHEPVRLDTQLLERVLKGIQSL
jgi:hypothetical protein